MKPEWKTCLRVGVSAFALFLCIHYWEPFTSLLALLARAAGPLIVGACIAYVVNIPMSFYERHYFPGSKKPAAAKSRRGVCLLAAYLTFAAIVALLLWIVLPELANCLRMLLSEVPGALNTAATWLMGTELFSDSQWLEDLLADINWRDTIARAAQVLINGIGGTVNLAANVLTRVFSSVVNLVLGLIFATYLLIDRDRLRSQLERLARQYLRERWTQKIRYLLSVLNSSFHSYIVGQCTEAIILGTLCALGMALFGFPYAVMIGAVVGAMALIPIAGAYVGGAVGFLLILTVSPLRALLFVVYLIILQQLEGNLIYPRVVGGSIGLPGLWVLAAVTVGGGVSGITGMLLGVPVTATVYKLLKNDLHRREQLPPPAKS